MRVLGLVVFTVSALFLSCAHSAAEMRMYCLHKAHVTVMVPAIDSMNREPMVREYYLRCLEVHDIPDVPVVPPAPTATVSPSA